MNPVKIVTASLLLAAAPMFAHAEDMSYRYIQLGYISTDLPSSGDPLVDFDSSATGFASRGSIGFAKNFFLFTELNMQDFDAEDTETSTTVDFDLDQTNIGLGGHYPLSDNLDLVGRAGWSKIKLKGSAMGESESIDDTGYIAAAGLRGQIGENFELEGNVIHQDYGSGANDFGSDTGGEVLVRFKFNKRWAIAGEYQDIGDFSSYIVGVRASF